MKKKDSSGNHKSFDVHSIDFISLMDQIDEGVIITDKDGKIRYYNPTQAQIDDMEPEFVIGKKVTDIYELCGSTSHIMLCIKLGQPLLNKTFFYKTIFGKIANTIHSTFPIIENGLVIGTICFVKDYKILQNTTPVISIPDLKPKRKNETRYTFADIIGKNQELVRSVNTARTAVDSASPIMLIGETGTGKELFAQSIHNQSQRAKKNFIGVNCAAIPENLLEGLLFGTTKGAFTGAVDKPGLLEQANGSTIFLDELLSMPLVLQAKLLRVLQEKKVRRIGSTKEVQLNIKIISSVSIPPRDAVQQGELRTDLFYRIGVVMIKIPPLRERLDDLSDLMNHFILSLNAKLGTHVQTISEEVLALFQKYHWPGNIRELEHTLEGAMNLVGFEEVLYLKHFSSDLEAVEDLLKGGSDTDSSIAPPVDPIPREENGTDLVQHHDLQKDQMDMERNALNKVLTRTRGNVSKSAKILGISRQLLHYKMKKHGLKRTAFS